MTITYNIVYDTKKVQKETERREELRQDLLTNHYGKKPTTVATPIDTPKAPSSEVETTESNEPVVEAVIPKKQKPEEPVTTETTEEVLSPESEVRLKELEESLWKRTRPQLVKIAKKRQISLKGAKADLVDRILGQERGLLT